MQQANRTQRAGTSLEQFAECISVVLANTTFALHDKHSFQLCCPMQGQAGSSRNDQLKNNRNFYDGEASLQTKSATFTHSRPVHDSKARGKLDTLSKARTCLVCGHMWSLLCPTVTTALALLYRSFYCHGSIQWQSQIWACAHAR